MSKAFPRESDDLPDPPAEPRLPSSLPPGTKNYLTADGARWLREELERLVKVERPQLANSSDPIGARQHLRMLDQRIRQLQQCLESAEVVPPPPGPVDQVRFGATVRVRDRSGVESSYRIVGIDETDIDQGWVSWRSPIARALFNARLGERVRFRFPSGEDELVVLGVSYEQP